MNSKKAKALRRLAKTAIIPGIEQGVGTTRANPYTHIYHPKSVNGFYNRLKASYVKGKLKGLL